MIYLPVCVCVYKESSLSIKAGSVRALLFNTRPSRRVIVGKWFRSEYLFCTYLI